jgi:hypothetical protein
VPKHACVGHSEECTQGLQQSTNQEEDAATRKIEELTETGRPATRTRKTTHFAFPWLAISQESKANTAPRSKTAPAPPRPPTLTEALSPCRSPWVDEEICVLDQRITTNPKALRKSKLSASREPRHRRVQSNTSVLRPRNTSSALQGSPRTGHPSCASMVFDGFGAQCSGRNPTKFANLMGVPQSVMFVWSGSRDGVA